LRLEEAPLRLAVDLRRRLLLLLPVLPALADVLGDPHRALDVLGHAARDRGHGGDLMRRLLSLLLLPLSVVPFVAIAPTVVASHQSFQREHNMGPLPAPRVGLTGAERVRYRPFAAPAGQVPVLAW